MTNVLHADQSRPFDEAEQLAARAFFRGTATGPQQRIIANLLLNVLAPITASEPAVMSERSAGFLAGRKWVGYQLASLADIRLFEAREPDE